MNPQTEGRVASFLGLCLRAGRLVTGQEACVELARRDAAALVLMDGGVSDNTRKRMTDACRSHQTPLYELPPGVLGHSIGKPGRMMAAIGPDGMADRLLEMLQGEPRL